MGTFLSQEKLDELIEELEHKTKVTRREIAARLSAAKDMGDLSENFEYHDAKDAQGTNEVRIINITEMIRDAVIVDKREGGDTVGLGSNFIVEFKGNEKTFKLVGVNEASPLEGKISNESPLGNAFMGAKLNETVEVKVPSGTVSYKIIKIL